MSTTTTDPPGRQTGGNDRPPIAEATPRAVLHLFRTRKMDTAMIALVYDITEAEAYRLLIAGKAERGV